MLIRLFAPLINIFVDIINIFIRRDKGIILFGSWMGDRFADNSRYLFQYLNDHKNEYQIKKLIWATRDKEVYSLLKKEKYDVYMMHTFSSFYYHLKAGSYVICNMNFPVKGYKGDLMGQFAGRAVKINAWHGIPLKAGKSTGKNQKTHGLLGKLKYILRNNKLFCSVFTPGNWDRAYYLSTGDICTNRCSEFLGINRKWFIESGYPRDCRMDKLFITEACIIGIMKKYKYTVLYLPTFRDTGDVPNPVINEKFRDFIIQRGCLWIEKPHTASIQFNEGQVGSGSILLLNRSFDINVILSEITILITDYSSACYDAMAFCKPIIYYSPDYNDYACNDRGFLCDYKTIVEDCCAENISDLISLISRYFDDEIFQKMIINKSVNEKKSIFNKQHKDCAEIISEINRVTGIMAERQSL